MVLPQAITANGDRKHGSLRECVLTIKEFKERTLIACQNDSGDRGTRNSQRSELTNKEFKEFEEFNEFKEFKEFEEFEEFKEFKEFEEFKEFKEFKEFEEFRNDEIRLAERTATRRRPWGLWTVCGIEGRHQSLLIYAACVLAFETSEKLGRGGRPDRTIGNESDQPNFAKFGGPLELRSCLMC